MKRCIPLGSSVTAEGFLLNQTRNYPLKR